MKVSKVLRSGVSVVLVFVCFLWFLPFSSFASDDYSSYFFSLSSTPFLLFSAYRLSNGSISRQVSISGSDSVIGYLSRESDSSGIVYLSLFCRFPYKPSIILYTIDYDSSGNIISSSSSVIELSSVNYNLSFVYGSMIRLSSFGSGVISFDGNFFIGDSGFTSTFFSVASDLLGGVPSFPPNLGGGSSGGSGSPDWSDEEKRLILNLIANPSGYYLDRWVASDGSISLDDSVLYSRLHTWIDAKFRSDALYQDTVLSLLSSGSGTGGGGSDVNTNTGQGSVLWYLNRIEGYTSSTSADVGSALTEISSINGNLGDLKSNIISLYNEVQSNGGKLDLAVSALTSASPSVPFGDSLEDTSSDPWSVAQWLRGIYFSIVGIFSPAQKDLQDANEDTISDVAKSGLVLSGSDVSSVDDFSGELVGVLDTGVNPLYGFGLISDGSLFGFFSVEVENDLLSTPSSGRFSGSGPLKAASRGSPSFFDMSGLPKGIDEFDEENEILEDNLKEIEMDRGEG